MSQLVWPRLPIEPLVEQVTLGWSGLNEIVHSGPHEGRWTETGRRLDIDHAMLFRWRREGGIPLPSADTLACKAGLHPVTVWGFDAWNYAWALRTEIVGVWADVQYVKEQLSRERARARCREKNRHARLVRQGVLAA